MEGVLRIPLSGVSIGGGGGRVFLEKNVSRVYVGGGGV